jgi:hypothetical protein
MTMVRFGKLIEFKADEVLQDCIYLLKKYDKNLQGIDFTLNWYNIVSLLRTVGYILKHVDTKISLKHKNVITEEFDRIGKSKPEPEIFWKFIDLERNFLQKEYKRNVKRTLTLPTNGIFMVIETGGSTKITLRDGQEFKSTITEGHYKGQNEFEVAKLAVKWWESYIENIKKRIAE